jgi:hypothetical protein
MSFRNSNNNWGGGRGGGGRGGGFWHGGGGAGDKRRRDAGDEGQVAHQFARREPDGTYTWERLCQHTLTASSHALAAGRSSSAAQCGDLRPGDAYRRAYC